MTLLDTSGNQPKEAFYGGAAGGGKSEALLMAAAQYVEMPGYSALILRKTLPDLAQAGALIPRSQEWWMGTDAKWHENKKRWTFPSGAVIRFGYLEKDSDINNYYGSEYQFVGFDEATQFPFHLYRFLISRVRRKTSQMHIPLRIRSGSNPGNIGHEWVKERFLSPEGIKAGRVFVPAKLTDNPSLDQAEYRASLMELDPIMRAQLLDGDWTVSGSSGNFLRGWFDVINLDQVPNLASFRNIVRYWDTAATAPLPGREDEADYTVGTLMGIHSSLDCYVLDVRRFQGNPAHVESEIMKQAMIDTALINIFMEQEPGASGKMMIDHYARLLHGYSFQGIRSTGPKTARAVRFSGAASTPGKVKIVQAGWNQKWLDELEGFPFGRHDDQVDSAAGAYNQLTLGGEIGQASDLIRNMFSWRS